MWLNIFIIIILFLFALANLFLAIYVYKRNPKEKINKIFFCYGLIISLCNFSNGIFYIIQNTFWVKVRIRLAMNLYIGIPPRNAPLPKILLAKTDSYTSSPIKAIILTNNLGVY